MSRARDIADIQDNLGGATPPFVAGKNKIINGDFGINQRAFTSTTTNGTYGFDRWQLALSGATGTYSAQTFTAGTAPVAGYEGKNFARLAVTVGNDFARLQQLIEDVRTFAGQTVTLSFWAKGTNPATAGNLAVRLDQNFGTGGSPSASVATAQQTFVLTANWTRYSFTFAVSSISGKTIGTDGNSSLNVYIEQGSSVSTDAWTLDLWGVQLEAGSVATPFTTATGTIQGELAACQRYYMRFAGGQTFSRYVTGYSSNTNTAFFNFPLPVSMRVGPTAVDYSTLILDNGFGTSAAVTTVVLTANCQSPTTGSISLNVASGLTADRNYQIENNNSTAGYIGFSAEL